MREGEKRDAARRLRRNATDAERAMWQLLRDRRLDGVKFRRQVPIGPYVADFASIQHRLIVELDGGQHAESVRDPKRDSFLTVEGWRILRFWNNDVLRNRTGVLEAIQQALTPTLSRKQAGEGVGCLLQPRPGPITKTARSVLRARAPSRGR